MGRNLFFTSEGNPSSTKRNSNVSIWLGMGFVKNKRSYNI